MATQLSTAEAADKIQKLCEEGMTHAQIKQQHPELADGWGHNVTRTTATRPSRGAGASDVPRPFMARP